MKTTTIAIIILISALAGCASLVAEGISPQTGDLPSDYLNKGDEK